MEESPFLDTLRHIFLAQPSSVVIGAMALSVYTKRPRATADIDILSSHPVSAFAPYFEPAPGIASTMMDKQTHIEAKLVDVDHSLLNRKVVQAAMDTAIVTEYRGLKIRVVAPEMLVALKLGRAIHPSARGNQDRADIQNLINDNPDMDLSKIRQLLDEEQQELLDDLLRFAQQ